MTWQADICSIDREKQSVWDWTKAREKKKKIKGGGGGGGRIVRDIYINFLVSGVYIYFVLYMKKIVLLKKIILYCLIKSILF